MVSLPRMRGDMGKKYYIGEIPENTLEGIEQRGYSLMRVNAEDVIDGDRLRYDVADKGETIFNPRNPANWQKVSGDGSSQCLILDPPKPEGDEFWKWADGHPNPNDERFWNGGERKFNLDNYDRARKAWFAKMPRKP